MRTSRRAATAAVSVSLALAGVTAAHADSSTVLYVNGSSTSCIDSGTGTQAVPYCTIQAAANAAVAGETVDIEPGIYTSAVDVKSQGTAAAPILFQAVDGWVNLEAALSFDGASYVTFEGGENRAGNQEMRLQSATVNTSSHIFIDRSELGTVEIAGTSTDSTVSRDWVRGSAKVDAGSSGDVISTNLFTTMLSAISVTDAADIAITSNTIEGDSGPVDAIGVSGASTAVTVENNIVAYPGTGNAVDAEIAVDTAAASGTTLDYNVVWPYPDGGGSEQVAYSWAGTKYSSAAALYKATGQAKHDLNANPYLNPAPFGDVSTAPQNNSANSSAPGMLATDIYGYPCSGDPVVAVSGSGTPADCARGAAQPAYATTVSASAAAVTALSVSLTSSVGERIDEPLNQWGVDIAAPPAVSYTVNWGDGITKTYPGSTTDVSTGATHTYARLGTYPITDTADFANGTTAVTTTSFTTAGSGYTPYGPTRILDTRKGLGAPKAKLGPGSEIWLKVAGVGPIPSNVTAVAVNLTVTDTTGGGYIAAGSVGTYAATSNLNYSAGETLANSDVIPVNPDGTIQLVNEGGTGDSTDLIADISGYFTQGSGIGYTPVPLKRILDTRNGTGAPKAKVPASGHVSLGIAGADSIPSGVKAVAVHVTVTDATGGGNIAAETDGAGVPSSSSLNYSSGQTISNTVIVPVASDGRIELYNSAGSGSVDLIADVSGYFAAGSTQAYMPLTGFRAFDSRDQGELYPNSNSVLSLADWTNLDAANLIPAGATVITNITITGTQAPGNLTVYPDKTALPAVSDLNFLKGQTVANLGLLATTGSYQSVDVYNHSTGFDELILDVYGYFATS